MIVHRSRRRLYILMPVLGFALVLLARTGASVDKPAQPSKESAIAATPPSPPQKAPESATKAQRVTVGCYMQNVPEIEVKTNSFKAEFYLWFLWSGDIDPTLTYQLTNAIGMADLTRTPTYTDESGAPKPEVLPDGRSYQVFHVQGRFGHPFPLTKYPFDEHELVISVEDSKHPIAELVHDIDVKGSTTRPDLTIPGWKMNRMRTQAGSAKFATTFGDPRASDAEETYSHVEFLIHVDRPVAGLLSKNVVPLAIIILITFGAFFCPPDNIDARLCITITALISAVALQFTASSELPPTGYLILLDKIYILSYAMILAVTSFCIAVTRLVHDEKTEAGLRLDRIGLWLCSGSYFGILLLILALH